MRPASFVAWRWLSLKYAGTVMTAFATGSPKCAMSVLALCGRLAKVVDRRAEVRPRRGRPLELPVRRGRPLGRRLIPRLTDPPRETRLDLAHAREQLVPARPQRLMPRWVEAA